MIKCTLKVATTATFLSKSDSRRRKEFVFVSHGYTVSKSKWTFLTILRERIFFLDVFTTRNR